MPWGFGRGWGWRNMFWLTGLPGWARAGYFGFPYFPATPVTQQTTTQPTAQQAATYPAYLPWFWRCRWFPWLPRWWWTGMYGPVTWTPYGPTIATQQTAPSSAGTQDTRALEQELAALEESKRQLEQEIESLKQRIEELKRKENQQ